MKKNYFLTAVVALCFTAVSFGQTPVITMISDGDCSGGTPKVLEIYANGTVDFSLYSLENQTNSNTTWGNTQDLSSFGTVTDGFVYIVKDTDLTVFNTEYPSLTDAAILVSNTINVNGDDRVRVIQSSDSAVIDQYGAEGTDGTGTDWEYKDGFAKRNNGTPANSGTFSSTNWTNGNGTLDGEGSCQGGTLFETIIGVGSYVATASSDPSLSITSPTNGVTLDAATSVTISIAVANFSVTDDGTGDGHIHWTVQENSDTPVAQSMKYNTNDESIAVTAGNSYTVYMELVDNSHTAVSPAVNTSTTFTVAHPCDLVLGDISTTCDALTSGSDTFNGSIAFTGGNTGITYTITADSGTIGGDDPSSVAEGTITFTDITEETDVAVAITGGTGSSCDYTRTLYSPVCVAFPVQEFFEYTAGIDLIDSALWQNNSTSTDEIQVVAAAMDYPSYITEGTVEPVTGNMVSFEGSGSDSYIEFNGTSTGTIYTSFLFTATDMSTVTNNNGGYFAILAEAGGSYRARLWLKPDATDATKFNIGVSAGSSTSNYSTVQYDAGASVFVVMSYDFTSDEISVWVNPSVTEMQESTAPAATLTETGGTAGNLGRFVLRQDSASETPAMYFDELRISTAWQEVTLNGVVSVPENFIQDFAAYPNPVRNGKVTITTADTAAKTIRIYNVLGKQVFVQTVTGATNQLTIENLHTGMYILKIESGDKVATKKLVIR